MLPDEACARQAPLPSCEFRRSPTVISARFSLEALYQMLRYRLDELGWFQFESLVQSLLKTKLALGIESWGGPGDQGRDAYFAGPLPYPSKDMEDGPFLFQTKFLSGANAAGASCDKPLLAAVRAECARIRKRAARGTWQGARHYVLLTNAKISPAVRAEMRRALLKSDAGMSVHFHGGTDICDLLDDQPELRRSFPQLLSISDLSSLISREVQREAVNRSATARACASELPPVFVPTTAYDRAWRVLQQHHFAVLEGPPEMGKTAIAWMIGTVQLTQGRDMLVCDKPDDFFRSYEQARAQVFIADDAFGRTEYEPARGRYWEHDLDRVLRALDAQHWLLWTSRKHILARALQRLDLQGRASKFPAPAEVLVDASKLRLQEKALILYRHAKAASLGKEEVAVVKLHASLIVHHESFTPERIRRFVAERLTGCVAALRAGGVAAVRKEIDDAIGNPTDRMRKTFQALTSSRKWVLVGLLECGRWPQEDAVRQAYETHGTTAQYESFDRVVDELTESFVNRRNVDGTDFLVWVHPSCRDLVIEELSNDPELCRTFLRTCSPSGLTLAISQAGGAVGGRQLPLMASDESWTILGERVVELIRSTDTATCCEMLTSIADVTEAVDGGRAKERLLRLLAAACQSARETWDKEGTILSGEQLRVYARASTALPELPRMPDLRTSWSDADRHLRAGLNRQPDDYLDTGELDTWSDLVGAIAETEPRFIAQREFPADYEQEIDELLTEIDDDLSSVEYGHGDQMRDAAERLDILALVAERLSRIAGEHVERAVDVNNRLAAEVSSLRDRLAELEDEEVDYEARNPLSAGFDIAALFSDL